MLACSLVTRTCLKTTRGLISGTFRRLTLEVLSPQKTIALLFENYSNFKWLYLLACLKWEDVGTLDSGERSLPFGLLVLFIWLNSSSYKSPFKQYYSKPVLNPNSSIISLPKNDKMLVLAKISFFTIFPIFAMEIALVEHTLDPEYFSNSIAVRCLSL